MSRGSLVESGKIVGLAVAASVGYGLIHDQITVRLSPAYFTEWQVHADFFQHPNLTVVALFWGVVATWWVGLILGVLLVCASVLGKGNPRAWGDLVRPLLLVMGVTGALAALGYIASRTAGFQVSPNMVGFWIEDQEEYARFSSVWVAHTLSYFGAGTGGLGLCVHILRKRRQPNSRIERQ